MSEPKPRAPWQRWEMARFDAPPPAPQTARRGDAVMRVREERQKRLVQIRKRAQENGYAQGHAQGLAEGAQQGHEEGYAQGYAQGLREGRQAGQCEGQRLAQQHAQQLHTLAQACAQALECLEADVGQSLVHLAISIAQQVLRSTLQVEPEKLLDSVRDIVHMHGDTQAILTLYVHPQDHELVQHYLAQDGLVKRWRLLTDETIEPGGCRAETGLGAIDATLQTRWRRVVETLGVTAPTISRPQSA